MRLSFGNKRIRGTSWAFYTILGVCFKAVRAVFLEIFGYIQTDTQTYIQKVSCYNTAIQQMMFNV